MPKVTLKGFIHKSPHCEQYSFFHTNMSAAGYKMVVPYEFEVDVPTGPSVADLDRLNRQLKHLNAAHADLVRPIKERIADLMANRQPAVAQQ